MNCTYCDHVGMCHKGQFPRTSNCRNCVFVEKSGGEKYPIWRCGRYGHGLDLDQQREGCDGHLYIPELIPGEVIDFDEENFIALYKLANGSTWSDGTQNSA